MMQGDGRAAMQPARQDAAGRTEPPPVIKKWSIGLDPR